MLNYIIAAVLVYAVLSGTSLKDYQLKLNDLPWIILVIAGFTISFLGLFYYNDERIIFLGCAVLFGANMLTWREHRKERAQIKEGDLNA